MREEVKQFAEEMEKILLENDFKGGWENCEISYLYCLLYAKIEKFKSLMENELYEDFKKDIQRKTIDIANYCMMIHERLNTKIFV